MSTSIALDSQAMPFFARFLVEEEPPKPAEQEPTPIPIWTLKWPSDWEER